MKILIERDSDGWLIHKLEVDKTQNVKTNVIVSRVCMHPLMRDDENLEKTIFLLRALTAMLVSFLYVKSYKSRNKLRAIFFLFVLFFGH